MIKRIAGGIAALLVLGLVGFQFTATSRHFLPSGTGIVAKQLCSLTWVSGLDTDYAREIYLDPLLGGAGPLISHSVNDERRSVSAGVFGLFWNRTATYREGLGCTLVHRPRTFDAQLTVPFAQEFDPFTLDTAHRDTHFDTDALIAAIEGAFDDPQADVRHTLGVAVFHQGRLVGEHYAPQASRETRFHGWSMTKSTMATLAGVLQHQGRIDIHETGAIPALRDARDDRSNITISHLLRMTGGLEMMEYNDGYDPNSQMLFTQTDMAAFAARARRLHQPGDHWQYMSGDTILASSAMQAQLGDDLVEQTLALRTELFEPLGIGNAVMEPDQSGTFQGSSYMYATAHDWARLALLYANNGQVGETRLLPEDWYEVVSRPTDGSDGAYGMGFWLPSDGDGLPADTIMLSGFQGQWGYVMPSEDLVVVRFGATVGVNSRSGRLAQAILAAKRTSDGTGTAD